MFRRFLLAAAVVLLGTVAVLSAPFVRAEADGRLAGPPVNPGPGPSATVLPGTTSPAPAPSVTTPPVTVSPTSPPPVPPSTQPSSPSAGSQLDPPPGAAPQTPGTKVLYLTFDDGPSATWTPRILAILAANHAHATFFELGDEVKLQPRLPATVLAAGHRIGNHTYDHKALPKLTDAQIRSEIARGPKATCLRPPYGAVNDRVRALATEAGLRIQLWDVDTRDWAKPGAAAITEAILEGAHNGAVVLMHDGGGDRSQTVAALQSALPTLAAAGYTFRVLPGC